MNQPELGKTILELRKHKGLTQMELAENCNLSLRTIQRIESAKVVPRSHTTKTIFSFLGYDSNNSSMLLSGINSEGADSTKNWLKLLFSNAKELFNLKTNTMKKLSVMSLIAALITIGLFLKTSQIEAQSIKGWFLSGSTPSSYTIGLDENVRKSGDSSAFIASTNEEIKGFGTLMQMSSASEYLGKRIKMTAYIKSENVANWAGMWLRVDSKGTRKMLSFDNMQDRPIKNSTNWGKYEIVLDVPEESGTLNFGLLLAGTGKVWFDGVEFEEVDRLNTKLTNKGMDNGKLRNLDFSE